MGFHDSFYGKRFFLIYVDRRTQQRTTKDSACGHSGAIAANGEYL